MKKEKRKRLSTEGMAMVIVSGLILTGIIYLIKDLEKNSLRLTDLENELKICEIQENYERCSEIKKIIDNIKNV